MPRMSKVLSPEEKAKREIQNAMRVERHARIRAERRAAADARNAAYEALSTKQKIEYVESEIRIGGIPGQAKRQLKKLREKLQTEKVAQQIRDAKKATEKKE